MNDRLEKDSLGEVRVPADALYGAQTQRAIDNFAISDLRLPRPFIRALGLIKAAAAAANAKLGLLDHDLAAAIETSALEIAAGRYDDQFPVDVFQTGSGTSSNMNANEVIATLSQRQLNRSVHPNDHVNMGQSSNDVIPTAIHVSALLELQEQLLPALDHLRQTIDNKAAQEEDIIKTGRTHLMDGMPLTLSQELGAWSALLEESRQSLDESLPRLLQLAQGGTAVGTGVNTDSAFARTFARELCRLTSHDFQPSSNFFAAQSAQTASVELSGKLKTLATNIIKIANDLRWMNSGPLTGLAEIELQALQPGSSIMPGKVNPVIPEAAAMAATQVMGNDVAIGIAGQSGNFQLNVMLPLIAWNLLQSIQLLAGACRAMADKSIATFRVQEANICKGLHRNPILATALNPVVGYEKAAEIAKRAYREDRPVVDVAEEMTELSRDDLQRLLDPKNLV